MDCVAATRSGKALPNWPSQDAVDTMAPVSPVRATVRPSVAELTCASPALMAWPVVEAPVGWTAEALLGALWRFVDKTDISATSASDGTSLQAADEGWEIERDLWVQLPPKRRSVVTLQMEYQGRAKPKFYADLPHEDE